MNAGAQTVSPQDKARRTGWLLHKPAKKKIKSITKGDLLLSRSQRLKDTDTDTSQG